MKTNTTTQFVLAVVHKARYNFSKRICCIMLYQKKTRYNWPKAWK